MTICDAQRRGQRVEEPGWKVGAVVSWSGKESHVRGYGMLTIAAGGGCTIEQTAVVSVA